MSTKITLGWLKKDVNDSLEFVSRLFWDYLNVFKGFYYKISLEHFLIRLFLKTAERYKLFPYRAVVLNRGYYKENEQCLKVIKASGLFL